MAQLRPQSIRRGFSINAAARIAAAALGLAQLIVLAHVFGAGSATDAWNLAIQLPLLLLVFLTGPLHTSFIPVYTARRERDAADPTPFVCALYTFLLPALAVGATLMWMAAPNIIAALAPGFEPARAALAVTLLRWMAPLIVLTGLAEFPAMLFLAHRRYTLPALGSLFFALGVVVATALLGRRFGIVVAAQGAVAAVLLEAVLLTRLLPPEIPRPRFTRRTGDPDVAQVFRLLWPRFVSVGGNRINLFVDNIFASTLPQGVLTALTFGEKLTRVPLILFVGPLTRTIMPVFSEWAARGETERIATRLARYTRLAAVLACGVGAVFVFFPYETVRVFFRRGAFDDTAVQLTAIALLGYGVGMLSYAVRMLVSTVFFALQDTITPMKWALVSIGVNVLADWLLLRVLGHGGIALATAVVETVVAVGLYRALRARLGALGGAETLAVFAKSLCAAGLLGAAAWLAARFLAPLFGPIGFWRDLLLVACAAGPAGGAYLYVLHRAGVREVGQMAAMFRGEAVDP